MLMADFLEIRKRKAALSLFSTPLKILFHFEGFQVNFEVWELHS